MHVMFNRNKPPLVTVELASEEAHVLLGELEDVAQAFPSGLLEGDTPYGVLYRRLKELSGHHVDSYGPGAVPTVQAIDEADRGITPAPHAQRVPGNDVGPVPQEHLEWVVRVFHATQAGHRKEMAISRPWGSNKAKAEDFFTRTCAVHKAKAGRGVDDAFLVVLGTQDDRKWRKDRQWTEVKEQLCKRDS